MASMIIQYCIKLNVLIILIKLSQNVLIIKSFCIRFTMYLPYFHDKCWYWNISIYNIVIIISNTSFSTGWLGPPRQIFAVVSLLSHLQVFAVWKVLCYLQIPNYYAHIHINSFFSLIIQKLIPAPLAGICTRT